MEANIKKSNIYIYVYIYKSTEILGDVEQKNKFSDTFHVLKKKKKVLILPYVPYIVAYHSGFTHLPSFLVLVAGSGSYRKVTSC